jgi:uncharacterized C2H2 Zn-finger protein
MSETLFKCYRCGYMHNSLNSFKLHLERKRECKPKESEIRLSEVKKQYQDYLEKKEKKHDDTFKVQESQLAAGSSIGATTSLRRMSTGSEVETKRSVTPEKRRKTKKLRIFGNENLDYISKSDIIAYVNDPLKGIQEIIKLIYFHKDHPENHTVRLIEGDEHAVEVNTEDGWTKAKIKRVFTKMLYKAADILEYNVPKKYFSTEFRNFIESMGDFDNEELEILIIEELGDNVLKCMKELAEQEPGSA